MDDIMQQFAGKIFNILGFLQDYIILLICKHWKARSYIASFTAYDKLRVVSIVKTSL